MTEPARAKSTAQADQTDRRVKLAFLAAAVLLAGVVYFFLQTGTTVLKSWPTNLPDALSRAKSENRRLLVIFLNDPPSETGQWLASATLAKSHNEKAIQDGKFIRVKVLLDGVKGKLAGQYRLRALPTMLILDPQGRELNRREGRVAEVDFGQGFLDMTQIQTPDKD